MVTFRFGRAALALSVILVAFAAFAQGHRSAPHGAPVTLRMTYVPGQRVTYTTRSLQTAPAPMGQTTTSGTVEIHTAAVNPDGSAQLEMHITNMDVQSAAISADARR